MEKIYTNNCLHCEGTGWITFQEPYSSNDDSLVNYCKRCPYCSGVQQASEKPEYPQKKA